MRLVFFKKKAHYYVDYYALVDIMRSMPITQNDIAEYCEVSPAAVSKVLRFNKHPEFSAHTRERILSAARDLNYIPNQLASGLRRGKTATIGLISACNAPELQDNVAQAARQNGHSTLLYFSQNQNNPELALSVQTVLSSKPAGLICLPGWEKGPKSLQSERSDLLQCVRDNNCPIVWLEEDPAYEENSDFVWCDDNTGIVQAVDHFHEQGYEHFVLLIAKRSQVTSWPRWRTFEQAVARLGFKASFVEESCQETRADDPAVREFVAECPSNTGILCAGDWPAVPLLHAAKELGRSIPDDLGVIMFGDQHLGGGFSLGEVTNPTISAIRRPLDQVGQRAVERLVERINGIFTGSLRRDVLPTELVIRESTMRKPT